MVSKYVLCVGIVILLVQVGLTQEWSIIAAPSPRSGANMIYDAKNERMVMFGGGNSRLPWGDSYNDVWTLSLEPSHERWQHLSPAGTPPLPRAYSHAIYDSLAQRMIVFGGTREFIDYFNDIWILFLEPGNESWEEMHISGVSPSPRCDASAIYMGGEQRMIIFGGECEGEYFNDAWSLDLVSCVWQFLTPTGTPPTPRYACTAIYEPLESRMIGFGGCSKQGFFNSVWSLDLTIGNEAWTELSVSGELPSGVASHVVGYDGKARRMYTFGGYNYPPFTYPEDIFYLDLNSLEWTRISLHSTPPGRRGLCGDFDYHNRRLIVFGGSRYYDYYFGDTYAFTVPSVGIETFPEPLFPSVNVVCQSYPNPTSRGMTVSYQVAQGCRVSLKVFDNVGRLIKVLVEAEREPGYYVERWDGKDAFGQNLPNGAYFYTLEAGEFVSTKKIILLR